MAASTSRSTTNPIFATRWRAGTTDFQSHTAKEEARRKILAAAKRHGIEVDDDDNVAHPSGAGKS